MQFRLLSIDIEAAFGNRQMVRGFLLNNQRTDFSWAPDEGGKPVANRVEARERPRSSIAPSLVFNQEGKLCMVIGSPGGHSIINYVALTLGDRRARASRQVRRLLRSRSYDGGPLLAKAIGTFKLLAEREKKSG